MQEKMGRLIMMEGEQNKALLPLTTGMRVCCLQEGAVHVLGYAVTWHQLLRVLQPLMLWYSEQYASLPLCRLLEQALCRSYCSLSSTGELEYGQLLVCHVVAIHCHARMHRDELA